tara:strand:- start:2840 stop:2971 length:132 start_codon:yes stop_codon:yes gene_type:complete
MNKVIILFLILCCSAVSCGKKGDPVYKDPNKISSISTTFLGKA